MLCVRTLEFANIAMDPKLTFVYLFIYLQYLKTYAQIQHS